MEEVKKSSYKNDDVGDDEEQFQDAFDEFPFHDCRDFFPEGIEADADVSSSVSNFSLNPKHSPASLRRRRFTSRNHSQQSISSAVSFDDDNYVDSGESLFRFSQKIKENEEKNGSLSRDFENLDGIKLNLRSGEVKDDKIEGFDGENKQNSMNGYSSNGQSEEFLEEDSSLRETRDGDSSFLIILAGLVIKAVGFQFNLLISFVTFPIWAIYTSYMFVMDPFGVMKKGREYLIRKAMSVLSYLLGNSLALVNEWLKEHNSWLKFGLKFGWGLLWSIYVCVVLVALLVSAFVVGGILMNVIVEEPITIRENLNFDYTEKSPTAFVPIIGCPGMDCGAECSEKLDAVKFGGVRVIPLDHKLQVTVSLKLPESDYNRNLGIFQVRVDFLGPDGKVLASSRHPCMMQFKSLPIRLLLTFLKIAPLLTGYTSESQDLNIKFKGFTEGCRPTSCLRVTIEQRAEFVPGAGIPEIYVASLTLESEQPLVKRIVWYWRRTLFIWVSMTIFTVELLFTLLCCHSIIIPKVRLGSPTNGAPQDHGSVQR